MPPIAWVVLVALVAVVGLVAGRRIVGRGVAVGTRRLRSAFARAGYSAWEWDTAAERFEVLTEPPAGRSALASARVAGDALDTFLARVHIEDRARVREVLTTAVRRPGPFECAYRVMDEAGRMRWLHDRGEAVAELGSAVTRLVGICSDITEARHAEDDLRAREVELREAHDVAGMGHWEFRTATGETRWSPAMYRIYGLPADQPPPALPSRLDAVHPDDRAALSAAVTAVLEHGTPFALELRLVRPGGELSHIVSRGAPVRDARGMVVGIRGTVLDLTAPRACARALEESERLLDGVADASPAILFVFDLTARRIRWASGAIERVLGHAPEAIVTLGDRVVSSLVHPEDQGDVLAGFERLAAAPEGTVLVSEYRMRHRDGSWRWMQSHERILRAEAGENGVSVVGFALDVTAHRQVTEALRMSERRLAFALESAGQGIWDWDIVTDTTTHDAAWYGRLGYDPGEIPASLEGFESLVHPDDLPCLRDAAAAHVGGATGPYALDARLRDRSGAWRWVRLTGAVLLRDGQGRALRMVGTQEDITLRKQAEDRLRLLSSVVEETPSSVMITDRDQKILFVNRSFERITGHAAADVLGQRPGPLLQGPRTTAESRSALRAAIGRGEAFSGEVVNYTKAGEPFWAELHVAPARDGAGRITHWIAAMDDVSLRKSNERELGHRTATLQSLLDAASYPIIATEPDGTVTVFNRAAERLLGWRADDVIGRHTPATWHDLGELSAYAAEVNAEFGTHHVPAFPAFVERTTRTGQSEEREWTWVSQAGARQPVELSVSAMRGRDGTLIGFITIAHDLRERKAHEASLRRITERFQTLVQNSPVGICTVDRSLRVQGWNAEAARIFGWDEAEVLGQPLPIIPAHDHAEAEAAIRSVFAGEPVRHRDARRVRRDGTEGVFAIAMAPLRDANGTVASVMIVYHDISARVGAEQALRDSEQRWRLLTASMPSGVFEAGADGGRTFVNERWCEIYGLSADEGLGHGWQRVLHPEDRAMVLEEWRAAIVAQRPLEIAFRIVRPDGSVAHIEVRAEPLRGAAMGAACWVGTVHDVTDRAIADAELRQYYEQVEEARSVAERQAAELAHLAEELVLARNAALDSVKLKSEFLANMSHEIRTPMNAIIGFTELLLDMPLDDVQRDFATTVRSAAHGLLTIINDILDFSKIEAGQLALDPVPTDLRGELEELADLLAPRAQEKGLDFAVRLAPGTPGRVIADPVRLRQILINLAGNAIKFTERGHVLIEVEGEPRAEGRSHFTITVIDSGIGIPADKLEHVFHKFTQADGSTSRRYGGTGLGLAICRQLAMLMGGEIGVTSTLGEGSRFCFEVDFEVQPSEPARPVVPAGLPAPRVLVVQHQRVTATVLREQLCALGARVEQAERADVALAAVQAAGEAGDPFTLAIVEWDLADMGGAELAAQLRRDPANAALRLAALVATGRRGSAAAYEREGFMHLLLKPVRQQPLRTMLEEVLAAGGVAMAPGSRARRRGPGTGATTRAGSGLEVLVVEDNAPNQLVARAMLERQGCLVTIAEDGRNALRLLEARDFDLIFMDCHMPEMDGYEATGEIRRREGVRRHTPIIALTASVMNGDRERCRAAGMDDFLSKPVMKAELLAVLERWAPVAR